MKLNLDYINEAHEYAYDLDDHVLVGCSVSSDKFIVQNVYFSADPTSIKPAYHDITKSVNVFEIENRINQLI